MILRTMEVKEEDRVRNRLDNRLLLSIRWLGNLGESRGRIDLIKIFDF
jgi:hypothetical protein